MAGSWEYGKRGEAVFREFYKDIVARIGYSEEATIIDVTEDKEFQNLTDIDFCICDSENVTLSSANLPNFSIHEVKWEGQCFAKKKTGNLYIEKIETLQRFERLKNEPNRGSILEYMRFEI